MNYPAVHSDPIAHQRAGLGMRLLARIVDGLILSRTYGCPLYCPRRVGRVVCGSHDGLRDRRRCGVSYEVLFIAYRGQTPGKRAVGVRVVRYDNG